VQIPILSKRSRVLALVEVLTPRAHANSRWFVPNCVGAHAQASRQYRVLALDVVSIARRV
jgi:hypothetical protein